MPPGLEEDVTDEHGRSVPNLRVFYYQLTIGAAHLARVKMLDALPGVSCIGVQLASQEKTREYHVAHPGEPFVQTVTMGTYEDTPTLTRAWHACRHLRSERPDLIIIDSPADPVQFILGRYAQRCGIPAITRWAATVLDHPRHVWKEKLKGIVYRGWDHYLVTGQRGLEYLETFGVSRSRTTICGNPVDADSIENEPPETDRRHGFLFVGRLLRLKNLERFLGAYLDYRNRGGRWDLTIVGSGECETLIAKIAKEVPSIRLLGHLPFEEIIALYRSEGALVLPSYSENWGLVVNEAMHAGMPTIVSTHCGCFPELIEGKHTGFAMDPLDEQSMSEALMRMERASVQERAELGLRGRALIQQFRPEEWARQVGVALSHFSDRPNCSESKSR